MLVSSLSWYFSTLYPWSFNLCGMASDGTAPATPCMRAPGAADVSLGFWLAALEGVRFVSLLARQGCSLSPGLAPRQDDSLGCWILY